MDKVRSPVLHSRFRALADRSEYFRRSRKMKARRRFEAVGRNTHDRVGLVFQNERRTNRRSASPKATPPQAIADDDHRRRTQPVFFRGEVSSSRQGYAKNREQFR